MPQHLKFDAAACSSKPYEKASPELIEQLMPDEIPDDEDYDECKEREP